MNNHLASQKSLSGCDYSFIKTEAFFIYLPFEIQNVSTKPKNYSVENLSSARNKYYNPIKV